MGLPPIQLNSLGGVLAPNLLIGLAVAFCFSLALAVVPILRQPISLCAMSLLGAASYYGHEFPGFLVVIVLTYAVATWLQGQPVPARRWRVLASRWSHTF